MNKIQLSQQDQEIVKALCRVFHETGKMIHRVTKTPAGKVVVGGLAIAGTIAIISSITREID